tara:strand:+ start:3774 stop:4823 length:1050 start_codon:yes stop_codon:yes gene_type:complete
MINQIALIKSFDDKDYLKKRYGFSHYIYTYERERLNFLIKQGIDNTIFYISNDHYEFNRIFFKMGFLYNIFKNNDFQGTIKVDGKTHIIKSFIDYFSLFEFKTHFYLNAHVGDIKYSFTFINYNKIESYFDILVDFINLDTYDNFMNINFIYDLNKNKEKILKLYYELNNHNKLNELKKPLLPKYQLPPIKDKPSINPFDKYKKSQIVINNPFFNKKKLTNTKNKKEFPQKQIINEMDFSPPILSPQKRQPGKTNKRFTKISHLENIIDIIDFLNITNDKSNKHQQIYMPLDKIDDKKIININTKLHKKIINNFNRLKISNTNYKVKRCIVAETIKLLNECILDLNELI